MPPAAILEAPITGVTVYPSQARVIRRGRASVEAGVHDLELPGLPTTLIDESVRVSGRGAARIVGVEVAHRFHADAPDPRVHEVEEALEELRRRDRALLDEDAVEAARTEFLGELGRRGGRSFAAALAAGDADAGRVTSFTSTLGAQLTEANGHRRELGEQRDELAREITAREAELQSLYAQRGTERRSVVVSIEADAPSDVELDIAYLVPDASWQPVYDARLDGTAVRLDWHGLVSQRTGEDWPAVDLALSTARPAASAAVPELDPWYLDVWQPVVRRSLATRAVAAPAAAGSEATFDVQGLSLGAALTAPEAAAEQGPTAVTYRLARPVAVPSDGSAHKATITTVDLPAVLDHVTAPKLAEEAYLRATVTNGSTHTLLPGRVSVFHGADFVGAARLELVAPGEEFELQLGVDDRVRIERKLVKRSTSKAVLGGTRKTAVAYEITVESHLPDATTVTVLDQFPVSRHESIKIRDQETDPDPTERTDLELLTWKLPLAAAATATVRLSFQLENPRDVTVAGWTD